MTTLNKEQVPKPKLNDPDNFGEVTIRVSLENKEPRDIFISNVNSFFNVETTRFTDAVAILENTSESEGRSFLINLHKVLFVTNQESNPELINRNDMIYKFAYDTFMGALGLTEGGRGAKRKKSRRHRRHKKSTRRRNRKSTRRRRRKH